MLNIHLCSQLFKEGSMIFWYTVTYMKNMYVYIVHPLASFCFHGAVEHCRSAACCVLGTARLA